MLPKLWAVSAQNTLIQNIFFIFTLKKQQILRNSKQLRQLAMCIYFYSSKRFGAFDGLKKC